MLRMTIVLLGLVACGGGSDGERAAAARGGGGGPDEGGEGGEQDVQIEEGGQMVVIDPEGRVGFQTEVRLEIESVPGTPSTAVNALGRAVQTKMTEIRGCYDHAVATDPAIEGTLKLVVATNAQRRISSQVAEEGFPEQGITRCVLGLLRQLRRTDLPADATVHVLLTARNTMAGGVRQVREHEEQRQQQQQEQSAQP